MGGVAPGRVAVDTVGPVRPIATAIPTPRASSPTTASAWRSRGARDRNGGTVSVRGSWAGGGRRWAGGIAAVGGRATTLASSISSASGEIVDTSPVRLWGGS